MVLIRGIGEFESTASKVGRSQPADMLRAGDSTSFAAARAAAIGAAERVAMSEKGAQIIAGNPAMAAQLSNIERASPQAARGFKIAVGVLSSGAYSATAMRDNLQTGASYGIVDPSVPVAQRNELVRGFDAGSVAFRGGPALTQGPAFASGDSEGGVPRAVLIGAGALVVVGGVVAFLKLRR